MWCLGEAQRERRIDGMREEAKKSQYKPIKKEIEEREEKRKMDKLVKGKENRSVG